MLIVKNMGGGSGEKLTAELKTQREKIEKLDFEIKKKFNLPITKTVIDNAKLRMSDNSTVRTISYKTTPNPADGTDISKAQNGSVKVVDVNGDGTELQIQSKTDMITLEADARTLFWGCLELVSIDTQHFDTSQVTNMSGMFFRCFQLKELDLSSFDTSNVTNMQIMFNGLQSLTSLDISSFDTSNVTNMAGMFTNCSNLTKLDLSNWDITGDCNVGSMCNKMSALTVAYAKDQFTCDKLNAESRIETTQFVVKPTV